MALPALLAPIGKVVASAGIWTAASNAFRKIGPKLKGAGRWVTNNVPFVGGAAAGGVGGFGLGEVFDRLGIEDQRLQTLSIAAVVIGLLIAVGQLVDFQIPVGDDS